ncbi:4-hydroxythreonine-4-phosphate dehydrogenase PdxA [Synechococcus sp. UW140]|uniref:4-hydroxythreonine-4-phosphate dehydrogenase PdxA n=1 Tax=Synechococcus sp. UW140 TaxID=368503 RepID=UPI000E0ECB0E|nr:4-hydroxythreonine-4-phosphate dehydrogenase PdxA [Synechococcus sp. UW140]
MSLEPTDANQRLVIALGDPAGIGMEVTLKALAESACPSEMSPLLVGCRRSLEITYEQLSRRGAIPLANPDRLEIDDMPLAEPVKPGEPSPAGGAASFQWLTRAASHALEGRARALVTAPIAKHIWHAAGHSYPGQTERLAELGGWAEASMLFTAVSPHTGWRLNTLLATTHIPLAEVPRALTPERVHNKLNTLADFCRRFQQRPKLHVAGLNPHAGENGQLGQEETSWLKHVMQQWASANPDVMLIGPLPPDTCWLSAAQAWGRGADDTSPDGYLALYHDQGLIPVKLLAFDQAVNTSLGLPFLRTSPDHGTGFDIAGMGVARPASMLAAIQAAWELSQA